jgi:hypothetical protein
MKPRSPKVLLFLVVVMFSNLPEITAERKIVQPKECRTSNYTCVLKKNDGVPFFCVRTARQRQQNARQKVRIVSEHNCIRRYPVEYEDENPVQLKDKD